MKSTLAAENVGAGYGDLSAISGIDINVRSGEVVVLMGSNGAGKTTTLLTLAGHLKPSSGRISLDGEALDTPLHKRAQAGVILVPEERSVFMRLTAAENLRVGRGDRARAVSYFPELEAHLHRRAGLLSGGQQQMVTLARALAAGPRFLLADELSLGLAPIIVERLLGQVRNAAINENVGVILVEQQARRALSIADRGYVLSRGKIAMSGTADELQDRLPEIEQLYLQGGATLSAGGHGHA